MDDVNDLNVRFVITQFVCNERAICVSECGVRQEKNANRMNYHEVE